MSESVVCILVANSKTSYLLSVNFASKYTAQITEGLTTISVRAVLIKSTITMS